MPVRLVQSVQDFESYTNIWLPSWIESGYELESYITPGIERYIFYDKSGDYGSVEVTPYNFEKSPVNTNFPFNQFTFLKSMKVIELDKLVIRKGSHSIKRFHEMVSFLIIHLVESDIDCYIALLNPQVYEAFVGRFQIPVRKLVIPNFSPPYIPAVIDSTQLSKSPAYERAKRNKSKQMM